MYRVYVVCLSWLDARESSRRDDGDGERERERESERLRDESGHNLNLKSRCAHRTTGT